LLRFILESRGADRSANGLFCSYKTCRALRLPPCGGDASQSVQTHGDPSEIHCLATEGQALLKEILCPLDLLLFPGNLRQILERPGDATGTAFGPLDRQALLIEGARRLQIAPTARDVAEDTVRQGDPHAVP
jgi:hypothetical protein